MKIRKNVYIPPKSEVLLGVTSTPFLNISEITAGYYFIIGQDDGIEIYDYEVL